MLKDITLGQFFPGDSFLHRLDPRMKLILTFALIIIVFVCQGFCGFLLVLAFIALATIACGIKLKILLRGLKPVFFIVIFTFVLNLFFQTTGNEIFHWWILRITDDGLRMALFLAVRLIMLVFSTQLLTLTTSPIALTDGLESLMRPLKVIHFPVHEIAMMMSIALRFIPTLMEETNKIMKAQTARGADFESGNLIQRAKAMVPLLVPLFVSAFRRADELALAMEARCYRGGDGRTKLRQLRFTYRDWMAAGLTALLLAGIIVLNAIGAF